MLFLKNTNSKVVSFDINDHTYTKYAKIFIDHVYPDRHTLIIGDSTKTIPEYQNESKFDIIFIDGGHTYDVAKQDLENCKRFAHSDTIVIMDDTLFHHKQLQYTIGPTRTWFELTQNQLIEEIGHIDFSESRGMSWGKYL